MGRSKSSCYKTSLHFINRASLSKDVNLYTDEDEWSSWKKIGDNVLHIELRRWGDIMVIAPLSANTLGKLAGGLCDNLLMCIVFDLMVEHKKYVAALYADEEGTLKLIEEAAKNFEQDAKAPNY